jgi:predicted RND superfamily exporter protein
MVISFGVIALLGISIDAFSIIFVAIITGLVIDYSIHTLVALDQIKEVTSLEEGFSAVVGYSGIPLFLSFMTSLLSFSVLFLSSFRGARNLGLLLITSLVLSFFLSLYLLPLIVLPFRLKKGVKNA